MKMLLTLLTFIVVFVAGNVSASETISLPIGPLEVKEAILRETDHVWVGILDSENYSRSFRDVPYTKGEDVSELILKTARELEKKYFKNLKPGGEYHLSASPSSKIHGVLADIESAPVVFDGVALPEEFYNVVEYYEKYYTPVRSSAKWVKTYYFLDTTDCYNCVVRGLYHFWFASKNGPPFNCPLVANSGNGFIYLASDVLSKGRGKFILYEDEAQTKVLQEIILGPKLLLTTVPYLAQAPKVQSIGNVSDLFLALRGGSDQSLVIESSTDFKNWGYHGQITLDKQGTGAIPVGSGSDGSRFFRAYEPKSAEIR